MEETFLWSPWRIDYILSKKEEGCIFCIKPTEDRDKDNLILKKGSKSFVVMNKYPYNCGHLMVVPYRHIHAFEDLDDDELAEINLLIKLSITSIKKSMNPDGFNIGINLGKTAGAGIEEHIHYHIIPRWNGDINFMTAINNIRIIPQNLSDTYQLLYEQFSKA